MTEQTQPAPTTFSTDTALLWVQLADETPEGQTFPVVPSELLLLLSTFLENRTTLLRTQVRLQSLTSMAQNAIKIVNEQRVLIDDLRAALPADWVPARLRNEEDAKGTHGSPELDEDAAKLEAMGQDAGPTVQDMFPEAFATAPQDVANDAPQGDPGDENPGNPAAVAAE